MTRQQRKLAAMTEAQRRWGAFAVLTPQRASPGVNYFADCIRLSLFKVNKANEAMKQEAAAIRRMSKSKKWESETT